MVATAEKIRSILPKLDQAQAPFCPLGGARQMLYSKEKEVLIHGPAGTGKTRACLEKVHLICEAVPGVRILLVRQSRVSMTESVLITYENKVLPSNHPFRYEKASRRYRQAYEYPNGSTIVLGGLDNVERIMSTEYDIIVCFEATEISLNDWESLQTRLRNNVLPYQQGICDCNPSYPQHWLIKRARSEAMENVASRFEDNPTITEEYLKTLASLTGHRRARLFEGLWVAAEGLVYPMAESCFVPHFTPPAGVLIGGIDFGFTNPFAALGATLYYDEDGRRCIYVWYERYKSRVLISDHAKALPDGHSWRCDPSEPDQIIELNRAKGIRAARANNSIITGINAVTRRMDEGTLLVSEGCAALRAELSSYAYPENKEGSEKPVDQFNHACDALRYMVMGVDRGRVAA